MPTLPIDTYLDDISVDLREARAMLLRAETGAGKTTRLPLRLLEAPWLERQRIIMLEPRRLAARHAATFMAAQLGESVGDTIGYAVRFERRYGHRTRLLVVTQGVYLRMVHEDPGLESTGLVIFDEFHERTLEGDLALALTRQSRDVLRPDLRLLIMSATLDQPALARSLPDAARHDVPGRTFAVSLAHHHGDSPAELMRDAGPRMARTVAQSLADGAKGVLGFLPGAFEIRQAQAALSGAPCEVFPLYSALPWHEQQAALKPPLPGQIKVVLATNIAETSLTIEGIDTVVDSGLVRRNLYSASTGMSRLETKLISRASAEQRRGRAGRTGPGHCIRLWSAAFERGMAPNDPPEIETSDLTALALELANWGIASIDELAWVTPPPLGAMAAARALLSRLGALDAAGKVTPMGCRMARWPLHPRLAAMIEASPSSEVGTAVALATLLSDTNAPNDRSQADIAGQLLNRLQSRSDDSWRRSLAQLRRLAAVPSTDVDASLAARCLARAYPDRIAMRRPDAPETVKLASGRGARLPRGAFACTCHAFVVAELDDRGGETTIRLTATLDDAEFAALIDQYGSVQAEVTYDTARDRVVAEEIERLGDIVVARRVLDEPDPQDVEAALLDAILASRLKLLPWSPLVKRWLQRAEFLRHQDPSGWPAMDEETLISTAPDWLAPFLAGMRSRRDLQGLDLIDMLQSRIDPTRLHTLDRLAPPSWLSPLGRHIDIEYESEPPKLRVPLQEMLGTDQHPSIMQGRVPLAVELLSPAKRPIQLTTDLPGFWRGSYAAVRKDLRGRYPKHPWPDDPQTAKPWRPGLPRN